MMLGTSLSVSYSSFCSFYFFSSFPSGTALYAGQHSLCLTVPCLHYIQRKLSAVQGKYCLHLMYIKHVLGNNHKKQGLLFYVNFYTNTCFRCQSSNMHPYCVITVACRIVTVHVVLCDQTTYVYSLLILDPCFDTIVFSFCSPSVSSIEYTKLCVNIPITN